MQVFWNIKPCQLVNSHTHFEESRCFYVQNQAFKDEDTLLGVLGPEHESIHSLKTWVFSSQRGAISQNCY